MRGKLLLDLIDICADLIDLRDSDDDLGIRGTRVVDGLDCLRHDTVICSNYEDRDIRYLGTTGTHRGKCFVTRSIEERDLTALAADGVSTDVLRDTAGLALNDGCRTDLVEERCFTMVNVTHDNNDRRTARHGV